MSSIRPQKRKRSASPEGVIPVRSDPPLPGLSADALLTVFTHPSLGIDAGIPDNSRFQTLGGIALEYAIARLILAAGPQTPAKTLNEKMRMLLSDDNIAQWADDYHLRVRLRFAPEAGSSVDKCAEKAALFKAYAGAVDQEHGPMHLVRWIEDLIDGPPQTEMAAPPPAPPPAPPLAPPPDPHARAGMFSARLYEQAQQYKLSLNFESECTGPSHNLTWIIHVHVDGKLEASGRGSSKAAAKEEAARTVCALRNWNN